MISILNNKINSFFQDIDIFPDGLLVVSEDKIIEANKAIANIIGYSKEELINIPIYKILNSIQFGDITAYSYYNNKIFNKTNYDEIYESKIILLSKNNNKIHAFIRTQFIKENTIIIIFNFVERTNDDIYAKLNAEKSYLFYYSAIAKIFINKKGHITDFNQAFLKLFPLKNINEISQFNLHKLIDIDEEFSKKPAIYKEVSISELNFSSSIIERLHSYGVKYISCYLSKLEYGNDDYSILIEMENITERKILEEFIKEKNIIMDHIIENIPSSFALSDVDNDCFISCNEKMVELVHKKSKSDIIGKGPEGIIPEEIQIKKFHKKTHIYKFKMDNEYFNITNIPITIKENNSNYYATFIDNVTDMALKDQYDLQRSKMSALGQLAGGIAHDFNNHLMNIIGLSSLMETSDDVDEIKTYINKIKHSCKSASDLTKQILTFSKKNNTKNKNLNLVGMLKNILFIIGNTFNKTIEIKTKFNCKNSIVFGDESALENALLNLAINAKDAMPDGGDLKIEIKNKVVKKEMIILHGQKIMPREYILVSIKDTGIGIEEKVLNKIFDPYFTTKDTGTGLGLAVTYGTITSHGGYINVSSKINKGTIFEVYLPTTGVEKGICDTKSLMIIGNENSELELIKEHIMDIGYDVSTYTKEIDGLNEKHISNNDLIILKSSKNTKDVICKLKQYNNDIKIICIGNINNQEYYKDVIVHNEIDYDQLSSSIASILYN